jgi:HEAT repeat protein
MTRFCTHCLKCCALVLLFPIVSFGDEPSQSGPVAELQTLLKEAEQLPSPDDPAGPQATDRYGEKLKKQAAKVHSLPDLSRALALREWWSDASNRNLKLSEHIRAAQEVLLNQFAQEAKKVVRGGDPTRRAALASLVSGMTTRNHETLVIRRMLAALVPDLVELATPKDDAAAVAAMLGRLGHPSFEPTDRTRALILPALERLLTSPEVHYTGRRAAAAALESIVAVRVDNPVPHISRLEEVVAAVKSIVPVAARGLDDKDAEVRRLCLEVQRHTALKLQEFGYIPPTGHPSLSVVGEVIDKTILPVRELVQDTEVSVRISACQVIETLAETRRMLLRIAARPVKMGEKPFEAPWRESLQKTLPALEKNLSHKEVKLRLAALYALESYGAEAAPAAEAVLETLRDDSFFVRWGGVRVLGRIAPQGADKAVPALAKRLSDESEDVRVTAALVLGRFGASAKPAVDALSKAIEKGSPVLRARAIPSLAAIGTEANDAQPAIVLALSAREVEVRLAAAKALSHIGPLSEKTIVALRKALADSDPEVQRAAAIALLQGK